MTQVDNCESDLEGAFRLNAAGSANVAAAAKAVGARLIAVSTDYVFRGDAAQPYTENDATEPQTVYGMSKLAGENAIREIYDNHVIARIAWLYGSGGPSFLHTMLKLADGSRDVGKCSHMVGYAVHQALGLDLRGVVCPLFVVHDDMGFYGF